MAKVKNVKIQTWGFWLMTGILLSILGLILISTPVFATLASVIVFGSFLIIVAAVHLVSAFLDKEASHLWLHLIMAAITFVIGFLMLFNPGVALVTLTLLIAALFLTSGLFRVIGALTTRFQGWEWYLASGLISILLGILILMQWPTSSLWVIGLFLGIDLLFAGISLIIVSLFFKRRSFFS